LEKLTLDEKLQFFAGDLDAIDHISGVKRLGIPDINMGDGPNGVANTIAGTATSFPCNLAAGDTFDQQVIRKYAQAMAKEFKAKGKNQILGPGSNLARISLCGRQDEYMGGDDPLLSAESVRAFVKGALDEHVMVMVKHFLHNEQETNRNDWSADPDVKTSMEIYMQPFLAGIEAGAAALMCAYNQVNEMHACKHKGIMQAAKKAGDAFWIASDWGAVYSDAADGGIVDYINAGMDMEMGTFDTADCDGHMSDDVKETEYGAEGYCNKGYYMLQDAMKGLVNSGKVSKERVDETVGRILRALNTAGLLDPDVQAEFPTYAEKDLHSKWYGPLAQKDVRTSESRLVAQEVATKAMVLLQNSGGLLPLAASARVEMYGCGEEVHFRAESGSAAGTEPNIPSSDERCKPDGKTACPYPDDAVTAAGVSLKAFGLEDGENGPQDPDAVTVVCLVPASKNSEGTDRENLDLDGAADFPFEKFDNVVVYVVAGGPVLMPFASQVDAILYSSLPGEMGGAAFADVLLGKASPSGHLSLTMPESEKQTISPTESSDAYNEGWRFGYRGYGAKGELPNFAFGWGLSYLEEIEILQANISTTTSDGRVKFRYRLVLRAPNSAPQQVTEAGQVVQLYVQHLKPEARPFKQLAGFGKAQNLVGVKDAVVDIVVDPPKVWDTEGGTGDGWDGTWKPVVDYKLFVSLHGVEHAVELYHVTHNEGNTNANLLADLPIKFVQADAVAERAKARGLEPPAAMLSRYEEGKLRGQHNLLATGRSSLRPLFLAGVATAAATATLLAASVAWRARQRRQSMELDPLIADYSTQ